MIIDCHGHYTTAPKAHEKWRVAQLEAYDAGKVAPPYPTISDDDIRESLLSAQLKIQEERGIDVTIFSPKASAMAHHLGDLAVSKDWTRHNNNLIHRVCKLFPDRFVGVCQLPQSLHGTPKDCVEELERCVTELGFVGCNLNPDVSGGNWSGLPLTDESWYPLYEKMTELDVPAMIHVSGSCNCNFHTTGAHYINGDTTVFMQLLTGNLFKRFPSLKFIIPHGGGAAPYHWGRYRGLAQELNQPPLAEHLLKNVFFDTCVYHQAGIDLLTKVVPVDNILFATEMLGAVKGIDPETSRNFDDTGWYLQNTQHLQKFERNKIFEQNARRIYSRLSHQISAQASL